jgi:hemolysin III
MSSLYYTIEEERANWITHAVAVLLSIVGVGFLMVAMINANKGLSEWISCVVYCVSLILLYAVSTSYHAVKNTKWKHLLRIGDHSAIYIKIAGTFTPVIILAFPLNHYLILLVALWVMVLLGIAFKIFFVSRFNLI